MNKDARAHVYWISQRSCRREKCEISKWEIRREKCEGRNMKGENSEGEM